MEQPYNQIPIIEHIQQNQITFSTKPVINQKAVHRLDFLDGKWKQSLRRIFGPINPPFFIFILIVLPFFLIFTFLKYGSWVFQNPDLSLLCPIASFLAMIGAFNTLLISDEFKKPTPEVSSMTGHKDIHEKEELLGILALIGIISLLAIGATIEFPDSFFAVMSFEATGLIIGVSIFGFTSRVDICESCVNGPTNFRKIKGQWTCLACGTPKEP